MLRWLDISVGAFECQYSVRNNFQLALGEILPPHGVLGRLGNHARFFEEVLFSRRFTASNHMKIAQQGMMQVV